jgi:hypothetical protein
MKAVEKVEAHIAGALKKSAKVVLDGCPGRGAELALDENIS